MSPDIKGERQRRQVCGGKNRNSSDSCRNHKASCTGTVHSQPGRPWQRSWLCQSLTAGSQHPELGLDQLMTVYDTQCVVLIMATPGNQYCQLFF